MEDVVSALAGQTSGEINEDLPSKVMLWSDKEAALKQIEQVGTSACGATAALNVLVRYQILNIYFKLCNIF
jgi:hypothetical protein